MLTKNWVTHKSSQPLHLQHIVFKSIVQSLPGWIVIYLNTVQSRNPYLFQNFVREVFLVTYWLPSFAPQ